MVVPMACQPLSSPILAEVRRRGADAIAEFTARFDGVELTEFGSPPAELAGALDGLDAGCAPRWRWRSIGSGRCMGPSGVPRSVTQVAPGGTVTQRWVPVRRVGLYVPGGLAMYPSSVVMNVVPAQLAAGRGDRGGESAAAGDRPA